MTEPEPARRAHRQICRLCHEVCRVDFWVPDEVWRAAMQRCDWSTVACLACFTRLADERGVEWCRAIELRPMSRVAFEQSSPVQHAFVPGPPDPKYPEDGPVCRRCDELSHHPCHDDPHA